MPETGRLLLALFCALVLALTQPAPAQVRTVTFAPTETAVPSPERGFWIHGGSDFLASDASGLAWMQDVRQRLGYQLVFALVRLDAWREADLPAEFLTQLETALTHARAAGVKLIVRFSYNNGPVNNANAPDAPLTRVRAHIQQIAPVLVRNADTLAVIQAGFIGQWGEGHGSTNNLTSAANKAAIRDELLASFPAEVPLQWRRPPDLMAWSAARRGRFGFHNDCFLSSPDDTGTWTGTATQQAQQRAFAADLTDRTPFTAETCVGTVPRFGCLPILAEGRRFHLTSLNGTFHPDFHSSWSAEGCRVLVERYLGYRLRLNYAVIDPVARNISVSVTNEGWSRLHSPRLLRAAVWRNGRSVASVALGPALLGAAGPGETLTLSGALGVSARHNDVVCLSAPEPIATGRSVAAYAIRFANAEVSNHSWWSVDRAAFCFTVVSLPWNGVNSG